MPVDTRGLKRDIAEARRTSEQNTVAYNLGRDAPYAERLLFDVPPGGTEDPDQSGISGALAQQLAGKVEDAFGAEEEATDRRLKHRALPGSSAARRSPHWSRRA